MAETTAVNERRGIPAAAFVEDVQIYLDQLGLDVNSTLAFLQERLQQYKIVEMKLLAQQRELQAKIPDIEKCLDIVATLQAKKGTGEPLLADFEVSEGIYSRARIEDSDSVCLWLGANVMLEYSCEEASSLLTKNLENAKASLDVLVGDLQFLRDQVTITQALLDVIMGNAPEQVFRLKENLATKGILPVVTVARVYNWDVHHRRQKAVVGASGSAEDA
ncbi:hypothetical protein KSS87_015607 [Heliosperma pusillum]|nr:hypothetical protein KSS87_015607 [Heliosperma pusillum]